MTERPAALSFASIPRPAFGSVKQHLEAPKPAPRLTTKADRRHAHAAKTAAELLPAIPEPGETVHALMTGGYNLCQVIVATAKLLPDLKHVRIATLCFNKRNVSDLCALIETRKIALTVLTSRFFRNHNRDGYAASKVAFEAFPGCRLAYAKNHAKVTTFDFGTGDALVFEGSANLRANDSLEQLAAFRSRPLHDFHAAWIDDLVSKNCGEEEG